MFKRKKRAQIVNTVPMLVGRRNGVNIAFDHYETFRIEVPHYSMRIGVTADVRYGDSHTSVTPSDIILFIHGLGCSRESWHAARQVSVLNEFTLCAVDLPGHGDSTIAANANLMTHTDVIAQVIEAIDPMRKSRVIVVGHSMGGVIGLLYSQFYGNVLGFINIEGNVTVNDCQLSKDISNQSVDDFVSSGFYKLVLSLTASSDTSLHTWGTWLDMCDPRTIHESATSLYGWSRDDVILNMLNDIPNTVYYYGRRSAASRIPDLEKIKSHVDTQEIAGAEHFPMIDDPKQLFMSIGWWCRTIANSDNDM